MPVVIGVAVGGALGALARYGIDEWIGRRAGPFPWGIFVVNISGAFLIGLLVEVMEPRFEDVAWLRTAVITGFLGAYTTFSTLSLDTYRLLDEGHIASALMNSVGSLALGVVAVWLGLKTGRALA
jgi:fluoride exporter